MRDFSPSGAAGPSKLRETLLAGAKGRQKVAVQLQVSLVNARRSPQVDLFVPDAKVWSMLDYLCPEKRRQALRGRNLPRDIRAEVRQGALALER